MFERLPFEISCFVTTEDMTFVLNKTVKGVKAQSTRENWGRKELPDGKFLWVLPEMPYVVRHTAVFNLLQRDGEQNDFCALTAKEYSSAIHSFSNAMRSGYYRHLVDATLWCRRLEMVDDIMFFIPNYDFESACVSVAYATGIGFTAGVDELIAFTKPEDEYEVPLLDMDRRFWLTVILERLRSKDVVYRSHSAKVLPFPVADNQPGCHR